ncbi:MAG: cysteine synthase A [Woeseiaceae bacterium]|nr:cysteine synthase A [Woeseiaceae bacterium]
MKYDNILETVGNTPLVRLSKLGPEGVNVWVKVEAFNPMGSVKDRMALAMIEDAEKSGALKPGQTVVEATSGNTGIGLAMVCAQKGYPLVVTMAESFSVERRKLLRFLGAKVVLTPAAEKGTGMMKKAEELAAEHGWFTTKQFENPANADVHYRTTAREILADLGDQPVHAWVSGFGTGGTILGVSRAMREASPETRIIAAEPDNSPVLGAGIPQPRDKDGRPDGSHPHFRPHLMQGWSPDFISDLTQAAVDDNLIDDIVAVNGDDAMAMSQALAQQEGIFVGTSSGATLAAALEYARTAPKGSNIVAMLPDTGERYLSTPLFGEIGEDMTEEEVALSQSTPNYRFDTQAATAAAATPADVDPEAAQYIADVVDNEPVVMFALEWCEFCWSLRKLFDALGVKYRSVDIDSVEYQENDRGVKIRGALGERVGAPTMPQVFIAGEHVGGCTEVIENFQNGALQSSLERNEIDYDKSVEFDAWSLLPQWLHPRKSA